MYANVLKEKMSKEFLVEYFPEGALIYRLSDYSLLEVNETGAFILKLLENGLDDDSICLRIADKYAITPKQANRDYQIFCQTVDNW